MQSTPSYPSAAAARKASWKAPGDGAAVSGSTVAGRAAGPELVGRERGAVDELLGAEPDGERDDGQVPAPRPVRPRGHMRYRLPPGSGPSISSSSPGRYLVLRLGRSPVGGGRTGASADVIVESAMERLGGWAFGRRAGRAVVADRRRAPASGSPAATGPARPDGGLRAVRRPIGGRRARPARRRRPRRRPRPPPRPAPPGPAARTRTGRRTR